MTDNSPTLESLQTEIEELKAELAAEKARHAKTKKRLKVERAPKSAKPRELGAMKPPKNEQEKAARETAIEGAFAGNQTEVVFSDGKRELRELHPLMVGGDAWRVTPQGRVLDAEPLLEPGDCQRARFDLAGFALLNEAGDQVAYQALPAAITIERNRRYQLPKNTIRF